MSNQTVSDRRSGAHRELPEIQASAMAKANLRKPETDWRAKVGRAIARAMRLVDWSLDRLAREVGRDPRQVARWISGAERPHLDALFALDDLRQPLVLAFAELSAVEIATVVTIRKIS